MKLVNDDNPYSASALREDILLLIVFCLFIIWMLL